MKTSILIVSHSKLLANGLKDVLEEISKNNVKIIAIGGINGLLGTDADSVISAIQERISDDYILIFCDIGSSILTTKMVIDSYFQEYKEKIVLVNAPMVEGSIAMTAQLAAGSTLTMALEEAKNSYNLKIDDIGYNNKIKLDNENAKNIASEEFNTYEILVKNRYGLHARPVSTLISLCNKFDGDIFIKNGSTNSKSVNAKSMSRILSLNVKKGDKLLISIQKSLNSGTIFNEIKKFLEKLELDENNINYGAKADNYSTGRGQGVSPGIAIGKVFHFNLIEPEVQKYAGNIDVELKRFNNSLISILNSLHGQQKLSNNKYIDDFNNIYISVLEDNNLIDNIYKMIENGYNAEYSWNETIKNFIKDLENTNNEYLIERIIDFNGIRISMLKNLAGLNLDYNIEEPCIIIAEDIPASFLAQIDNKKAIGLISVKGSVTGHAALIARNKSIPYIINAPDSILSLKNSDIIAINGETGEIFVNPDSNRINELNKIKENEQIKIDNINDETQDGTKINILANISGIEDATKAKMYNAMGVGLFRTEFIFMNSDKPPSINEQVNIYMEISSKFREYPIIVRLLDAGADKPVKFLNQSNEPNPQLGTRGVRLLLKNINILREQLESILIANQKYGNIAIMVPMVTTYNEVYKVKDELNKLINSMQKNLKEEIKIPEFGIMIETPAAIMELDKLCKIIDFASIGTNDLTQYTYGIDRASSDYNEILSVSPPLLKFISMVVQKCKKYNINVSLCGSIASNKNYLYLLLGAGIRKLSVDPVLINSVKTKIRELKINECEREFKKLLY